MTTNSKCKLVLCLALPLTLATAFASDTRTENIRVGKEVFEMITADKTISYDLSASVNNGVVTLAYPSSRVLERQRVINEVWQLPGVSQVKNELGINTPSTQADKAVAVRD